MKFKKISKEDIKVLREAKKVLKKLQKKENKLDERLDQAMEDDDQIFEIINEEHDRFLDELEALSVRAEIDGSLHLFVA